MKPPRGLIPDSRIFFLGPVLLIPCISVSLQSFQTALRKVIFRIRALVPLQELQGWSVKYPGMEPTAAFFSSSLACVQFLV